MSFMQEIDWSPLWLSLKTGAGAALLAFFLGTWMAERSMRQKKFGRALMDGIFTMPLVLPPTVIGFLLLCLFSIRTGENGISVLPEPGLMQSWKGYLVASTVIAFPLMYRNARAAFEQVNENMIYVGRTLGMSEWTLFVKVVLPASIRGILSGGVLTLLRAMGEYGAAAMLVQNTMETPKTLSLAVAAELAEGRIGMVGIWSACCVFGTLLVLTVFNVITGRGMKARRWI